MSEASFASLNPALLARKGGAKPAMRPQLAPLPEDPTEMAAMADEQLEDLGWNDMGSEGAENDPTEAETGADVVSISASAANEDVIEAPSPIVRRQQKDLTDRVLADAAMPASEEVADEPVKPSKRKAKKAATAKKSKKTGKRAAFTLRLDADRHLKLRLASTMKGVSAQAFVTEALDAMLTQFEELDALAERMQRN
ncbi:hypothetical protein [Erythrobacter crassostreae]|uniref:Uncharacterized protein n=1 Tax=Erythrobacter crassostreae TaxID=2828328 RepID=A0A9X1JKP1_9SPHN|nr:hypothetical protein [Erythrobacter crassostrea]MBV7259166.1 hypothetical protein [Erythrobacter crassostrea]